MYTKIPFLAHFILIPFFVLLVLGNNNLYAAEKVTVHLKDGGKIIGKLVRKGQTSVTIQTKRMKISIDTQQIKTIKYQTTNTQINTQPPPDEQLESNVIDHQTCGHYNVLCNRKLIVLTVDSTLKNFRHHEPKKMCKTVSRVCKELKFQFQPISKIEDYFNLSMRCFQNYLVDYRKAAKGGNQTIGPQNITVWYSQNTDTVSNITSSYKGCLKKAETTLYE